MGFFDRFTSAKGKDQTAGPKRGVIKAAKGKKSEQDTFAAVPAATETVAKKGAKTPAATTPVVGTMSHTAQRVLLRPIVTEKSTRGGQQSQYTFEVARSASKADVRQSVRHVYGVTPMSINIVNLRGKMVRFGRTYGRTINRKKAIVTLPAGKTIDVVSA